MPKVSVVMSVYNGERYLREAVESILNQTFTDFEFIIIDDGSTDSTWQILTAYAMRDPRIVLIRNEKNVGLTKSLNKGLALARGEYIARQDADDVSLPQRLERQVAFLDNHAEFALVGCRPLLIDKAGNTSSIKQVPTDWNVLRAALLIENVLCHGSVVLRRVCLETVGFYREFFRAAQDYDLWLRIIEQYPVANLAEPLYRLREHPGSVNRVRWAEQVAFAQLALELAEQRKSAGVDMLGLRLAARLTEKNAHGSMQQWMQTRKTMARVRHRWARALWEQGCRRQATMKIVECLCADPTYQDGWRMAVDLAQEMGWCADGRICYHGRQRS